MPIPWLVVLQNVPWVDVIRNAPKVAEGAKKLWKSVAKKPDPPRAAVVVPASDAPPEAQAFARLEGRVVALESEISGFHEQMLASSELIKALAEQNGELVARVEANRVRVLWLAFVTVVAALTAAVSLYR